MRSLTLVAFAATACALTVGCKKPTETKAEPSSAASTKVASAKAKQPEGPPTFKLEGTEIKFPYAWVYEANGPIVRLSTHPLGCGGGSLPDGAQTLDINIGAGPGLKHFAGKPTAVAMHFYPQKTALKLKNETFDEDDMATLEIEPFKYEVGQHIKGTVQLDEIKHKVDGKTLSYVGGGRFDAEICSAGDTGLQAFDEKAPDGPVTFNVGGKDYTAKTVLAFVSHDADASQDTIKNIRFFDADGVTCDSASEYETKGTIVVLQVFGGANTRQKLFGSPVRAEMALYKAAPKDNYVTFSSMGGGGGAWLELDSLAYTAGAKIKGQVVGLSDRFAKAENKTKIGGHFEATVCVR